MGKYNFDKVWERAGHNAIKWDVNPMAPRKTDPNFTPLPMWIADMAFATAPVRLLRRSGSLFQCDFQMAEGAFRRDWPEKRTYRL